MPTATGSAAPGPSSSPPAPRGGRAGAWIPHAVLTVGTGILLLQILLMNGGKLVYTLDDPYIHLALAENIARGTYGVNLGEPSAPASSILYPFLLVPFAGLAILEWIPLAIAFVASWATLSLWSVVVERALPVPEAGDGRRGRFLVAAVVTLLIPTTNLVGVMFTGMEHSLQLFATALLIAGLVVERRRGSVPWWLWLAILLGPLIRYENLALSLPAIGYLHVRGARRGALGALASLVLLVGGFSLFLVTSGHGALPTSVLLKTGLLQPDASSDALLGRLVGNLFQRQGGLLAVMGALCAGAAFGADGRDDRLLAGWCATAVGLHLVAGTFGWFERYELYIWSAALLTGIVVFREALGKLLASVHRVPLVVGAGGVALALGFPYVYATLKTPLGSNNIYEQHYQMHRFATEFFDGPVAVTDIGWVSFRNDNHVLDLFGLAHRPAAEARLRGDASYVDDLAREHDVHLAMLYGVWYPDLPERWRPVAEMSLEKQRLTPAASVVTFYALDRAAEPRVRTALRDFGETLPADVGFRILP